MYNFCNVFSLFFLILFPIVFLLFTFVFLCVARFVFTSSVSRPSKVGLSLLFSLCVFLSFFFLPRSYLSIFYLLHFHRLSFISFFILTVSLSYPLFLSNFFRLSWFLSLANNFFLFCKRQSSLRARSERLIYVVEMPKEYSVESTHHPLNEKDDDFNNHSKR